MFIEIFFMASGANASTHAGIGSLLSLGGIEIAVEVIIVDIIDNKVGNPRTDVSTNAAEKVLW